MKRNFKPISKFVSETGNTWSLPDWQTNYYDLEEEGYLFKPILFKDEEYDKVFVGGYLSLEPKTIEAHYGLDIEKVLELKGYYEEYQEGEITEREYAEKIKEITGDETFEVDAVEVGRWDEPVYPVIFELNKHDGKIEAWYYEGKEAIEILNELYNKEIEEEYNISQVRRMGLF